MRARRYDENVTETAVSTLDARTLRADFPAFEREVHGKPLAYLDSANSSQKPRQVLDAMREFYGHSYANVHRAVYDLAERATAGFEGAREKVRALLNAPSVSEVIFTRNVTEALNLVAYSWGLDNLRPGDVVVVTELEHHANFVPWQQIALRTGAEFRAIPFDGNGELVLESLDGIAKCGLRSRWSPPTRSRTRSARSTPIEKLTAWAHEQGAIMVVDAAQAVPHRAVDVQALGCDFLGFTSHKLCGPGGAGALWGRRELLERMPPFEMGGEMIRSVSVEKTTWNDLPYKFEAGTPAIAEAYGMGIAIDYITGVGLDAIEEYEHELAVYAMERLAELPFVTVYGPPPERHAGIVSFNVEGVHPHDVAQILDWEGVAIRAGHHCTQPLVTRLGVAATNRASFYLYSLPEEVDRLVEGVKKAKEALG